MPLLTQGANRNNFEFRTAAENFRLVEEDGIDVVVPWDDDARRLLAELNDADTPQRFLRPLQPYTVRLRDHEAWALRRNGTLRLVADRFWVLDEDAYDPVMGVQPPS